MELRLAWTIIRRWWLCIVILTLVGVVAAYQYYKSNPPSYTASVSVAVRVPPPNDSSQAETELTASQASEALSDDLVQIIPQSVFTQGVLDYLKAEGKTNIGPGDFSLDPERKHREVNVNVAGADKDKVLEVARATGAIIAANPEKWVGLVSDPRPAVGNIVDISSTATLSGGRSILLALLRVVVGLIAGFAVAFLLHYLDTRIREPQEVTELLGLPVLGTVPPSKVRQRGSLGAQASQNGVNPHSQPQYTEAGR